MKSLKKLIIEILQESITLYHGTSQPVEKIKANGLIPGNRGGVFLTDNIDLASEYAQSDQERTNLDSITIVSVNSKDLDEAYLVGDVDHTNTEDWVESLSETDQCIYLKHIAPNLLTVEYMKK